TDERPRLRQGLPVRPRRRRRHRAGPAVPARRAGRYGVLRTGRTRPGTATARKTAGPARRPRKSPPILGAARGRCSPPWLAVAAIALAAATLPGLDSAHQPGRDGPCAYWWRV